MTSRRWIREALLAVLILFCTAATVSAGEADVVSARVEKTGQDTYRFDVTVQHADEGWNHYADRWEVLGPDGEVLARRVLLHPHVDEQPFTRSLRGVKISPGITEVTVRAHDSVHGYGGAEVRVSLPGR